MARLLRMPEVAANVEEAVLQEWAVAANVPFAAQDAIAVVETDKAVVEVPAPEAGVILTQLVGAGEVVAVGTPIAVLGGLGEQVGDLAELLVELGVTEVDGAAADDAARAGEAAGSGAGGVAGTGEVAGSGGGNADRAGELAGADVGGVAGAGKAAGAAGGRAAGVGEVAGSGAGGVAGTGEVVGAGGGDSARAREVAGSGGGEVARAGGVGVGGVAGGGEMAGTGEVAESGGGNADRAGELAGADVGGVAGAGKAAGAAGSDAAAAGGGGVAWAGEVAGVAGGRAAGEAAGSGDGGAARAGEVARSGAGGGMAGAGKTAGPDVGEVAQAGEVAGPSMVASGVGPAAGNVPGGRKFASPLARRLAKEAGLAIEEIAGTGPGGRVVRRDVEAMLAYRASAPAEPVGGDEVVVARASGGEAPAVVSEPTDEVTTAYTDVPHSRVRRAIAHRLTESVRNAPHFYLRATVRVDRLLKLRSRLDNVSVNDLLLKAAGHAHVQVPAMNVIWTPEAVRRFESVDIAVAVATERGLVTPVVREVERRSISDLARGTRDLAERARSGQLRQHELEGGTLTISNLGMYGTEEFSAIINPPHSAILAVGAARREVVVKKGRPAVATVIRCTLSVDHRPVDGVTAAQWLDVFVHTVERPLRILS